MHIVASAWTFRAKNVSFLSWDEERDFRRDLRVLCAVVRAVGGDRSSCIRATRRDVLPCQLVLCGVSASTHASTVPVLYLHHVDLIPKLLSVFPPSLLESKALTEI